MVGALEFCISLPCLHPLFCCLNKRTSYNHRPIPQRLKKKVIWLMIISLGMRFNRLLSYSSISCLRSLLWVACWFLFHLKCSMAWTHFCLCPHHCIPEMFFTGFSKIIWQQPASQWTLYTIKHQKLGELVTKYDFPLLILEAICGTLALRWQSVWRM